MITLYDYELSGNCYKIRLMLNILGLNYDKVPIDFYPGREQKSDWFLRINPLGQIPVLCDGDLILRDAQAILVYLAAKYDISRVWYPTDSPAMLGHIAIWLSFADALTGSVSLARLHDGMLYDADIDAVRAQAQAQFRILDEHLWFAEDAGQMYLCSENHPTIADIACFPYVMLSEEGGISRQDYPAIRRWCDRVRQIESFTVMSGIFPTAPAFVSTLQDSVS